MSTFSSANVTDGNLLLKEHTYHKTDSRSALMLLFSMPVVKKLVSFLTFEATDL